MPNVWRVRMKSGADGVDHSAARKYATHHGYVGGGWGLNGSDVSTSVPDGCTSLDQYLKYAVRAHPDDASLLVAADRIGSAMAVGDYCWMYDTSPGEYWCCQIIGDFVYRQGGEFDLHDLHILRPCRWVCVGTADAVPGVIRRAFAGPFGTVTRLTTGLEAAVDAAEIALGLRRAGASQDFFEVATPEDLEDVASLFLQHRGWSIYPSTAKQSMATYEFIMVNGDGHRAGIQVKSGNVSYLEPSVSDELDVFFVLFAASKAKLGGTSDKVVLLSHSEIQDFARTNWHLLPKRLQVRWPKPDTEFRGQ